MIDRIAMDEDAFAREILRRDIAAREFPARGYGRFIPDLMVSPEQLTSQ